MAPEENVHVHAKTWLVVAAVNFAYLGQLLGVAGSGLLGQSIGTYFGSSNYVWLASVINIFTAVLGPPISQASDLWGRKWLIVSALTCGGVGSIIAGRATSMEMVIAGYCVLAIAYGAQPLLHAVVSEVLPRKQRPMAQASINMSAAVGAVIGICMGGTLLRHGDLGSYRVYMYVQAAVFWVGAILMAIGYNPPKRDLERDLNVKQKLGRLDWIGTSTFGPGLVLFCVGLSLGTNPYPWSDGRVIGMLVGGIVLMICAFVYEWKFKKDGILHHGLFTHGRNFPIALGVIFCEGLAFYAANVYYSFEVSVFTGDDLLIAGVHFLVTFVVSGIFAFAGGWYSVKTKTLRLPIVVGLLAVVVFKVCMATATPSTDDSALWGFGAILGIGIGILLPTVVALAQLCTDPSLIAEASALILATRSVGATIGLAIDNAIFNSKLSVQIPQKIAAAVLPLGLPPSSLGSLIGALTANNQTLLTGVPNATPQILGAAGAALEQAYSLSFRPCWIVAAVFAFVGALASVFIRDPKEQYTTYIDAPAEESLVMEQDALKEKYDEKAVESAERVENIEKV